MTNEQLLDEQSKAFKLNNGANHYVCFLCAEKYREREPEGNPTTFHFGACYVCKKTKEVANSRALFGFHVHKH